MSECRCEIVGWSRDPFEPHIPAQAEWEQADDCPIHPLPGPSEEGCVCPRQWITSGGSCLGALCVDDAPERPGEATD